MNWECELAKSRIWRGACENFLSSHHHPTDVTDIEYPLRCLLLLLLLLFVLDRKHSASVLKQEQSYD